MVTLSSNLWKTASLLSQKSLKSPLIPNGLKNSMSMIQRASAVNFSSKSKSKDVVNADGPYDYGYVGKDQRFDDGKPSLAYAKAMPKGFSAMRHEQILQLCAEKNQGALREALIRNIMSVDDVEYDAAVEKFNEISRVNRSTMLISFLPYKIGLVGAVTGGVVSMPMVFHKETVEWFNENYVTAEVPEPDDIGTWLEVGSWAWAWMEPVIGQASFALLVAQLARSQMINLGIKPYGNFVRNKRAARLVKAYPQYDATYLADYSKSTNLYE